MGDALIARDICFSAQTGLIVNEQLAFYEQRVRSSETINLSGCIVALGFTDVQINGGYGFDFAVPADPVEYQEGLENQEGLEKLNRLLIRTEVANYLPTVLSQKRRVYAEICQLTPVQSRR